MVALAGNPNVGKSTVFNALTGSRQHTGNWSGKTVANAYGVMRCGDTGLTLVDLPGTYSLRARSSEERVARDFLASGDADAAILVADATCLERNLILVLQVLEVMPNAVLCLNLMDEARKKRIRINTEALQRELGLEEDESKFVIGLISRLTNQKGLDLVSSIIPQVLDGNTQVVVLGTGDAQYEDTFRWYEATNRGTFSACIQYDEARAHRIYAGADALLVPSRFEPCGLTQLNAMHYGTLPIVRETGGLKDTVEPYNDFTGDGNGFTFDRYEAGLLLDAVNRAKTVYFTNRYHWDEVVQRDMAKDVSWQNSARQYKDLYLELTQW